MSFQLCEKCCRTRSSSTQASKLLILGVHGGRGRRTETRRRCQRDLENHWHGIRGDDGVAHFDSSNGRWCSTAKVLQIPVVAGDRDSLGKSLSLALSAHTSRYLDPCLYVYPSMHPDYNITLCFVICFTLPGRSSAILCFLDVIRG